MLGVLCPTWVTQPRWGTGGRMLRAGEGLSSGVWLPGRQAAGTGALGRGSPAGSAHTAPVPTQAPAGLALVALALSQAQHRPVQRHGCRVPSAQLAPQPPQRPAVPTATTALGPAGRCPSLLAAPLRGSPRAARLCHAPAQLPSCSPSRLSSRLACPRDRACLVAWSWDRVCLVNKVMKQLRQGTEEPECAFSHCGKGA